MNSLLLQRSLLLLSLLIVSAVYAENLATLISQLPEPLGYWPLNKKFGSQNASPTRLDGVFRSSKIVAADGPLGISDTAYSFGEDSRSYIEFAKPQFNLGKSSFTISMFVKVLDAKAKQVAPLLEFPMAAPSQTAYGLNLWMWPDEKHLHFNAMSSGDAISLNCSFDDWAFIGAVYNNVSQTIRTFCNRTVSEPQSFPDSPLTSDAGFTIGKSSAIPGVRAAVYAAGRVASLSIYKKALNRDEIIQIYKLHKVYAEEPCQSKKCMPETCHPSPTDEKATTFVCLCDTGEETEECAKTTTTTTTTTTTPEPAPVRSLCDAGWAGLKCETPICTEKCADGSQCTAPDTCTPVHTEQLIAGLKKEYWIIILVIIVVLIIIIIVLIVYCCKKRKQNRQQEQKDGSPESQPLRNQQPANA